MTRRLLLTAVIAVLSAGLAACGSSKAPGVALAPSSGSTAAAAPATTSTTPTTTSSTSSSVSTPAALSTKPVVKPPSGPAPKVLVTKNLIIGTGKTATPGSTVTVNYVGVLYKNGKEFDSSWARNQPFTAALTAGNVIAGWVRGVPGMKVGGRRELIIPSALGYGKTGSPPSIPPNAPLVFVIDLLSVS